MNEQFDNSNIAARTDMDLNSPEVNSNPFTDKVPVDADLIHESPIDETVVHEMSMGETIVPEAPMDETITHDTPMDEMIAHEMPIGETITHEATIGTNTGSSASLLNREESELFRTRWNEIQGKFVDEPRAAVEQADALVSEVIELITEMFANEHRSLEGQWNKGNEVSTEDLRMVLQRYRSFFNSLVV